MPDLIIKPQATSGNKVILQDQAGGAVVTTLDAGAIFQSKDTISDNITIASGNSAMAIGPINFTGTVAVNGNLSIV
jgi:uncharacterized protein (DUF342 family)